MMLTRLGRLALSFTALILAGCPAPVSDPPPPPRKAEIAVAPPHALGALAGGTEAAPRPDAPSPAGDDGATPPPLLPPLGGAPDAGAPPLAPPSAPDAGMAL